MPAASPSPRVGFPSPYCHFTTSDSNPAGKLASVAFVFSTGFLLLQHCFTSLQSFIETHTACSYVLKSNEKLEEQGSCRLLCELQMVLLRCKAPVSQQGRSQVEPFNDSGVSTHQATPRQLAFPLLTSLHKCTDSLVRNLSPEIKEAWICILDLLAIGTMP